MAKINFKKYIIKDLDGVAFPHVTIVNGVEVRRESTVADVIQANLLKENQSITSTERFDRYRLAIRIKEGEEVDLSIEDLNKIKEVIGQNPFPMIVGRVWEVLEQALEIKK